MLVLLRKVGESIVIGTEVFVRVASVSGNRVSLAIEAPQNVRVDRKEIRWAKDGLLRVSGNANGRNEADCLDTELGRDGPSTGPSFVGRGIPMPNRMTGKEKREDNPVKRDDRRRIRQYGFPAGYQPNTTGLRAAIHRLIADSGACDGPEIEFCDDLAKADLSPELQSAVFSIVQELLLNACRHSRSERVLLGLRKTTNVSVSRFRIGVPALSPKWFRRTSGD